MPPGHSLKILTTGCCVKLDHFLGGLSPWLGMHPSILALAPPPLAPQVGHVLPISKYGPNTAEALVVSDGALFSWANLEVSHIPKLECLH